MKEAWILKYMNDVSREFTVVVIARDVTAAISKFSKKTGFADNRVVEVSQIPAKQVIL
jgi:hypothetical protein